MHPLIKFAIFAHPRRQCVAVALINNYGIKCTENQWQGLIWAGTRGIPLGMESEKEWRAGDWS